MEKKLHLVSLGCTKNLVDSEVMLGKLQKYILTDDPREADVIIVNTCGFIEAAKQESLETIFELDKQKKEDGILVMSGCLSERYKEEIQAELPEVDIFTGVGDYDKIDELIETKQSKFSEKVFLNNDTHSRVVTGSNFHAYIKLGEGCNQTCSFCAIPKFKGKLQSKTLNSIKKELINLVNNGFYDFSFISQDSSSFLRDFDNKNGLIDLIKMVETIEGVKSARILYLYPSTTSLELIQTIANSKIFQNYFDMPLQHISSKMLKIMKRGKGSEMLRELMQAMRNVPNSFVRTTFIVGHPGESEEDFKELCSYVKEFCFDRANVFSYSDEENTSSHYMSNKIPQKIIDKRAEVLGKIIEETTDKSLSSDIEKTFDIVIEGESDEHEYLLSARKLLWEREIDGEIYINDNERDNDLEFGKVYKALITEKTGSKLVGKVLRT